MSRRGHNHDHQHGHPHPRGHNGHHGPAQWQTPNVAEPPEELAVGPTEALDLDLVETAFIEAFPRAADVVSFLRLAGIPFVGKRSDGSVLSLLRVETNQATDVGSLAPQLGGGRRYDPLPAAMTSKREGLSFIYFNGTETVRLSLADARTLRDETPPR